MLEPFDPAILLVDSAQKRLAHRTLLHPRLLFNDNERPLILRYTNQLCPRLCHLEHELDENDHYSTIPKLVYTVFE